MSKSHVESVIPKDDIPDAVVVELEKYYDVSFESYGNPATEDCTSKRTKVSVSFIDRTGEATESKFEHGFVVRGVWNEENKTVSVYSITSTGPVLRK